MQPTKWWYMSALARDLGTSPSSLQKPLAALTSAGVLSQKREGNRVYFRAERASPFFLDLQAVIAKTAGVVELLRGVLAPVGARIRVAFVYGSVARSLERPESDIDLMVVGETGLAELAAPLERAEKRLGRQVNPTTYTVEEFCRKLEAKHHFLTAVLDKEKLFVVGSQDELEKLRGAGPRRALRGDSEGTRGASSRRRTKPSTSAAANEMRSATRRPAS